MKKAPEPVSSPINNIDPSQPVWTSGVTELPNWFFYCLLFN